MIESTVPVRDTSVILWQQVAPDRYIGYQVGDVLPPYEHPKESIVLTPRQFLQALNRANLRAAVEAAVAAADQDTKDWYARATEFESTHPVLLQMAAALGKTAADVDELFQLGQTL